MVTGGRIKYLSLVLAIFMAFSNVINVFSLDEATLERFSQNGIMFYDPESCVRTGSAGGGVNNSTLGSTTSNSQVSIVGDSITYGAKSEIKKKFGDRIAFFEAKVSKSWDTGDENSVGGKSGLEILKEASGRGELKGVVIVALGTNNISLNDIRVSEMVNTIGSNHNIVLVTNYNANVDNRYKINNDIFKKYAEGKNNVFLADWEKYAKEKKYKFDEMGVHPIGTEANTGFAEVLYNGYLSAVSGSQIPTGDVENLRYGYRNGVVSKTFPIVSDITLQNMKKNQALYQRGVEGQELDGVSVPWQFMALLHFIETNFGRKNDIRKNLEGKTYSAGVYQLVSAGSSLKILKEVPPGAEVSDEDLVVQTRLAVKYAVFGWMKMVSKTNGRGRFDFNEPSDVKRLIYGYNKGNLNPYSEGAHHVEIDPKTKKIKRILGTYEPTIPRLKARGVQIGDRDDFDASPYVVNGIDEVRVEHPKNDDFVTYDNYKGKIGNKTTWSTYTKNAGRATGVYVQFAYLMKRNPLGNVVGGAEGGYGGIDECGDGYGNLANTGIGGGSWSGLTEAQAKKLVMKYGENANDDSKKVVNSGGTDMWTLGNTTGPGSNCVTFVVFFVKKFTNLKYSPPYENGGKVIERLMKLNPGKFMQSNDPGVFSIFSSKNGNEAGHTGIVMGANGDDVYVGHSGYQTRNNGVYRTGAGNGTKAGGGAAFVAKENKKKNTSSWTWMHQTPEFIHLDSSVIKFDVLSEYLGENINKPSIGGPAQAIIAKANELARPNKVGYGDCRLKNGKYPEIDSCKPTQAYEYLMNTKYKGHIVGRYFGADCSFYVSALLAEAGVDPNLAKEPQSTASMIGKNGYFGSRKNIYKELIKSDGQRWADVVQPGDIRVCRNGGNGHVHIVYGYLGGKLVVTEASRTSKDGEYGKTPDIGVEFKEQMHGYLESNCNVFRPISFGGK